MLSDLLLSLFLSFKACRSSRVVDVVLDAVEILAGGIQHGGPMDILIPSEQGAACVRETAQVSSSDFRLVNSLHDAVV